MPGFSDQRKNALHLTWVAFFLTFAAWFNMAPFNTTIMKHVGLSLDQIKILMICNVALTIPARIVIGALADRHGPKRVFLVLLPFAALICFYFAISTRFFEFLIARLLMGIVGASFVVGVKMIAEWFPPDKMGTAQGIYAGWGNFGAAAAAFSLPGVALWFPEETGWRMAAAFSGLLCLIWTWVYWKWAREVPGRKRDFKVNLIHPIEVTSRRDLLLQIFLALPIYGSILVLVWKLSSLPSLGFPPGAVRALYAAVIGLFLLNTGESLRVNLPKLAGGVPKEERYEFRQIFILSLVYALTFGSELAVVSMFPQFLESTFGLSVAAAGLLGSSFAVMNLIARPGGGWLSDLLGRRRTLAILVTGALAGYWGMGEINENWPLERAILLAVACSVFLQAGNGACFAAVPLIREDLAGKMAGMAGAYGSVGAVFFLTAHSLVSDQNFFRIIGCYALVVSLSLPFLKSFKNLRASYR